MNAYEFMTGSPILTFLLAYIAYRLVFRCFNRVIRHMTIRKAGWPPAHLDADGDFKPEPKEASK